LGDGYLKNFRFDFDFVNVIYAADMICGVKKPSFIYLFTSIDSVAVVLLTVDDDIVQYCFLPGM